LGLVSFMTAEDTALSQTVGDLIRAERRRVGDLLKHEPMQDLSGVGSPQRRWSSFKWQLEDQAPVGTRRHPAPLNIAMELGPIYKLINGFNNVLNFA
jgi:hypothetical protein